MTKQWIPILTGALAVQGLLVVLLAVGADDRGAFQPNEPLLTFDPEAVDEIAIQEGETQLVLRLEDEGEWIVPEVDDFPAEQQAVKRLLDRLAGLQKGWPVATTRSAAERFKVAESDFERRVTLSGDGEPLTELFVGSSPGFRKVHVREGESDEVHAVELSAFEASAKTDEWIDHQVLGRRPAELARIEIGDLELLRESDEWRLAGLGDDEETVASEARALVDKVARLRIDTVLGTEVKPEYGLDAPALVLVLQPNEGEPVTYTVGQPEGETYYVLRSSARPHLMKVAEFAITAITEIGRDQLVQPRTSEEPAAPDAAPAARPDATPELPEKP